MKIPKRLTKCLVGRIDFSTFHVLDVTPNKAHGSVVFLLPKRIKFPTVPAAKQATPL